MSILSSNRFTLREVAERCGVHPTTAARWITQGVRGRLLPAFLIGGRRFVLEEELKAFLRAGHPEAIGQTDQQRLRMDAAAKLLDAHGIKRR